MGLGLGLGLGSGLGLGLEGSAGPSVHPRGASNNAGVLLLRRVLPRLCVISRECSYVVR